MNCYQFSNVPNPAISIKATISEITAEYRVWNAFKNPPGWDYYIAKFGGEFQIVPDGNVTTTFPARQWRCDPGGVISGIMNTPVPTEEDPDAVVANSWLARGGWPYGDPSDCGGRYGYIGWVRQLPADGAVTFEAQGDAPDFPPYDVSVSVRWPSFLADNEQGQEIFVTPNGNLLQTGGYVDTGAEVSNQFYPRGRYWWWTFGGTGVNGVPSVYQRAIEAEPRTISGLIDVSVPPGIFPASLTNFTFEAICKNGETIETGWGAVEIYTNTP